MKLDKMKALTKEGQEYFGSNEAIWILRYGHQHVDKVRHTRHGKGNK